MDLIINEKTICGYISDKEYNNNILNIRCDDITDMGITLASCYNNKNTYLIFDDGHIEKIKINSVKINDNDYVEFGFVILDKDYDYYSIEIVVNHHGDIIRENITEDGHIDLFGITFSVERHNTCDNKVKYKLKKC